MDSWYSLQKNWLKCQRCRLHKTRRRVVLGRGTIPATILFVGEAPGKSEDLLGEAFVGISGRLLNEAMNQAARLGRVKLPTFYLTNVLGCRPTDKIGGDNREPKEDEAWACFPRLEETYNAIHPRRVIFLGRVAERFCKEAFPAGIHMVHPAYIARLGGVESTEFRAFVRQLSTIFKGVNERRAVRMIRSSGEK